MTTSTKVGLGFVAAGFVVGIMTSALELEHLQKPIWGSLLALCAVTIFVIAYRERTRQPPNSN